MDRHMPGDEHLPMANLSGQPVDFARDLNPEQLEAVETLDGPVLVIAGAGSGKTRTLVYRVAMLIHKGVDPGQILLLTFTRKAAATMLERASRLVGEKCQEVQGGTFHAFCNHMLRRYAPRIGYPNNFTIMDRGDVQDLLRLLARQLGLAGSSRTFPKKGALATIFSKAANSHMDLVSILENHYPHLLEYAAALERLSNVYNQYKKSHALMDYDDLLINWRDILLECEDVRRWIGKRIRYIMVDEYQDTNKLQAEIVKLMAFGHNNVMVVGDDSQSIYSFRGAHFKNILDFPRLFQGTKIIKLEKNYRSTQPNLDCTNAIIANARQKFTKRLVACRSGGGLPGLYVARDEMDQARFVRQKVEDLLTQGIEPTEVAVLFRAGFHSYALETELNTAGIPFIKRGGKRLVDAAHIKDMLCILRILINPLDRLSCDRIFLLIEKIGPKTAERIFSNLLSSQDPLDLLAHYPSKAKWAAHIKELGAMLKALAESATGLDHAMKRIESWYTPYLKGLYPDDWPRRQQELTQLRILSSRYPDAVSLLSDLAIDPPERNETYQRDSICLSTMHSAKGLEWKVVFIISLAEGRFPAPASTQQVDAIEEERRLFYVAATRAKDQLFFCYPAFINQSGAGLLPARPCRFLEEIPGNLLKPCKPHETAREGHPAHMPDRYDTRACIPGNTEHNEMPAGSSGFKVGMRVRHPIFGPGRIANIMDAKRIKVMFDVSGEKTLRLDFTELSII